MSVLQSRWSDAGENAGGLPPCVGLPSNRNTIVATTLMDEPSLPGSLLISAILFGLGLYVLLREPQVKSLRWTAAGLLTASVVGLLWLLDGSAAAVPGESPTGLSPRTTGILFWIPGAGSLFLAVTAVTTRRLLRAVHCVAGMLVLNGVICWLVGVPLLAVTLVCCGGLLVTLRRWLSQRLERHSSAAPSRSAYEPWLASLTSGFLLVGLVGVTYSVIHTEMRQVSQSRRHPAFPPQRILGAARSEQNSSARHPENPSKYGILFQTYAGVLPIFGGLALLAIAGTTFLRRGPPASHSNLSE